MGYATDQANTLSSSSGERLVAGTSENGECSHDVPASQLVPTASARRDETRREQTYVVSHPCGSELSGGLSRDKGHIRTQTPKKVAKRSRKWEERKTQMGTILTN